MVNKIFILLFLSFLINVSCKTCLENSTYIWGTTWDYKIIPDTMSTCRGIIACDYAICAIRKITGVSFVIIQPSNDTQPDNQKLSFLDSLLNIKIYSDSEFSSGTNSITCLEGQTLVMGLDAQYHMVHNEVGTCQGILNCDEMICNMYGVKEVILVLIMATQGDTKI
jgi:hypothetical protein